jgi:hypothetical protein
MPMRKLIIPLGLAVILLALGGRVPNLVDRPGGMTDASGVKFNLTTSYVALSPLSRTLDALTLLSTAQSIAVIVTVVIVVVGWKVARRRKLKSIAISIAATLLVLGILEAAAAFLPRPMASLAINDPDIVRVDFHSHTAASHDVRQSFSAEDNREWHRRGGFDIAYITDHVKFGGAEAALARNPKLAAQGVSLVEGMEGRYHKIMSTVVLGITAVDAPVLNERGNILSAQLRSPREPVTIIAIPNRNLDSLSSRVRDSTVALPNLAGIELVDAAPRGLAQLDREESKIRSLARDLGLTLVAGSNNHGYGRAVAAWNLMKVPAWRSMRPDAVASAIENQLRADRASVRIVHRTRPTTSGFKVVGTLPILAAQIIGGLGITERISWIVWIAFATAFTLMKKRRGGRAFA